MWNDLLGVGVVECSELSDTGEEVRFASECHCEKSLIFNMFPMAQLVHTVNVRQIWQIPKSL